MFLKWFLEKEELTTRAIKKMVEAGRIIVNFVMKIFDVAARGGQYFEKMYQKYLLKFQEDIKNCPLPEDPDGELYTRLCHKHALRFDLMYIAPQFPITMTLVSVVFVIGLEKIFPFETISPVVFSWLVQFLKIVASLAIGLAIQALKLTLDARELAATDALIEALESRDHCNHINNDPQTLYDILGELR